MTLRKLIPLATVIYFTLYIALPVTAQQKKVPAKPAPVIQRCHTTEYLNELIKRDPGLKLRMDADQERLNQATIKRIQERQLNKGNANNRLTAVVTIPVVVHIVLPNPNLITDADVIWQINKMNEDFAGKNADSVNAGPFAALFGHSQIQFCLAQQDEKGNATTAIERVSSATTFTRFDAEVIKSPSTCGAKSWDPDRYFNIWVGDATDGTLGIATFPNSGLPEYQGIAISYRGFSNNPAYVSASYNLGRTAVHEAGHFFYARHIWGDGACAADFPSIAGLPAFTDDTPPQSGSTTGCPTGTMASGCAGGPNPPGRMYQNYMDYTNDACYCMFTLNQVARMEAALDVFRASLKTSNACSAPVIAPFDAALATIINPVSEGNCISTANNLFCTPGIVPRVILKNYGSTTLTSATVFAQIDNLAPESTNWTGPLAQLATATIDLNSITATSGSHTLTIYVTSPNGMTDGKPLNDTLTTSFTVVLSPPFTDSLTEGFESPVFPPTDWKFVNPNPASNTWERTTDAAHSGSASALIRFYDYAEQDQEDYLLSPLIDVSAADSLVLQFERAYKLFDSNADYADSLAVVVSIDCGKTFIEVWKRSGVNLATVSGKQESPGFVPGINDWLNTRLNLKPFYGNAPKVIVGFKTVNRFGQNLYLDDINLEVFHFKDNDASITAITEPFNRLCTPTFKPAVTLTNRGIDTIKTAKIVFRIDNTPVDSVIFTGSLASGVSATIEGTKNITLTTGQQYRFTAYNALLNGLPDDFEGNDTLSLNFFVSDTRQTPMQESFDQAIFPPAGWSITASGNAYTWQRTSVAEPTGSAWIRNYRFNSQGKKDDLYSPLVQTTQFDSLYLQFDVAHVAKASATDNTPFDTLEVLLTTDCGKSFISVYKKWGTALQTLANPPVYTDTIGFIPSGPSQWRREAIDITQYISANSKFQVVFRNTSNNGNNTFLDNINIQGIVLPARLKSDGFILMPNPFNSTFLIRHVTPPVALKAIEVYNATGQLVYIQGFNGNANTYQYVNLGHYSSGVYIVKLVYNNQVITKRVIKQ